MSAASKTDHSRRSVTFPLEVAELLAAAAAKFWKGVWLRATVAAGRGRPAAGGRREHHRGHVEVTEQGRFRRARRGIRRGFESPLPHRQLLIPFRRRGGRKGGKPRPPPP